MLKANTSPITTEDGIVCFKSDVDEKHADFHASGLDTLYASEKEHFWFVARREKIVKLFKKHTKKSARVLEIGAGTGYIAQGLQKERYQVAIGEMHLSGLKYGKQSGIEECYQFDLFDPPFIEEFDAIRMFDVLEHLENDVNALYQVSKMLKLDGILFLTVPAHKWLWSRLDTLSFHKRRYSKKMLKQKVEQAGLQIREAGFFFILILPLLYLRRLMDRDNGEAIKDSEGPSLAKFNPIMNKILLLLMRFENCFSKWFPNIAGGSLFLVAEKKRGIE